VHSGQLELGAAQLREAIARHAGWAELLAALSDESAPGARAARTLLAAELPAPPGS